MGCFDPRGVTGAAETIAIPPLFGNEATDPVAGSDASEAAWVPISEVASLQLVEGLAEFLHENDILATIT